MLKELTTILELIDDENKRMMPPKLVYNEKFLLRLIMYWFSQQKHFIINSDLDRIICKALVGIDDARFYTHATLETPFKVRVKGEKDPLAEPSQVVSGVIGHYTILQGKRKERLVLSDEANQFIVLEATMRKPLKKHTKSLKKYNQIARDIGCMIQTLSHLENEFIDNLGLFVLAPRKTLKLESFKTFTYKQNIEELMEQRINQYGEDEEKQSFLNLFKRLFQRIDIDCIAFEDILQFILKNDSEYGEGLEAFYNKCLQYHDLT